MITTKRMLRWSFAAIMFTAPAIVACGVGGIAVAATAGSLEYLGSESRDPWTCLVSPGADLRECSFEGIDLSGTDMSNADLRGANLVHTNLTNADLSGANLTDANLRDANLRGANLRGANLTDAALCGAQLSNAIAPDSSVYPDGSVGWCPIG